MPFGDLRLATVDDEIHAVAVWMDSAVAMQRQGLARAVMSPVLATADANGVDAFLETSSQGNVATYAKRRS